jgi:hypothetical protein
MKNMLVIAILFLSASCATGEKKMNEAMDANVGRNINDVIMEYGQPSKTFVMPNGNTMYTWDSNFGSSGMIVGNGLYSSERVCKITLTTDFSQNVINWNYKGNACN